MDVELLISGGTVVTVDPRRRIITGGLVAVKDRTIVAVDDGTGRDNFRAARVVDATGCVVTPG